MSNLKASYPVIMDNYISSGFYSVHMVAIFKFYDQLVRLVLQEDFIREELFYANISPDLIQLFVRPLLAQIPLQSIMGNSPFRK